MRHFGKILDAYATSTIPKISVVLREAYSDAGSMLLGGVKGLGADLCYAWPIARYAVEASDSIIEKSTARESKKMPMKAT